MKLFRHIAISSAVLFAAHAMAADKPAIVLVHGAFEDAHVWDGVAKILESDGYRVLSVNLPGRPGSPASADTVSIDLYRDTVMQAISKETRPVVLVGHSFGGITISAVAEVAPDKIRTLVYLAAYLPRNGESLLSLANQDRDSKVGPQLNIDKERGMASINYAARADLFANDGTEGLRKALPNLILDEPLAPLAMPVSLSAARFGRVDKVYIHTARDVTVSPFLQRQMVEATPVRVEYTLNTGHTPFLTDAPGVAATIEKSAL